MLERSIPYSQASRSLLLRPQKTSERVAYSPAVFGIGPPCHGRVHFQRPIYANQWGKVWRMGHHGTSRLSGLFGHHAQRCGMLLLQKMSNTLVTGCNRHLSTLDDSTERITIALASETAATTVLTPGEDLNLLQSTLPLGKLMTMRLHPARNIDISAQDPLVSLKALLRGPIPDSSDQLAFDQVWQIFRALPEEQFSETLAIEILKFMSFAMNAEHTSRIQELCQRIAADFPTFSQIVMSLASGFIDQAFAIHEQTLSPQTEYIGSDLLLAHAIRSQRWEIAIQAFSTVSERLSETQTAQGGYSKTTLLWKTSLLLSNLHELVLSFSSYVQARAYDQGNLALFHHFQIQLACANLWQLDALRDPRIWTIFTNLKKLGVDPSAVYATALAQICHTPDLKVDSDSSIALGNLWKQYVEVCKSPSIPLISNILWKLALADAPCPIQDESVIQLVESLVVAANGRNLRPFAVIGLVKIYASRYNSEKSSYWQQYLTTTYITLGSISVPCILEPIKTLSSVAIVQQNDKRGIIYAPGIGVCWNSCLFACSKADNLDGTMALYQAMRDSSISCQKSVFPNILRLFAHRGDIERVQTILKEAEDYGIKRSATLLQYIIIAHLRRNNLEEARNVATGLSNHADHKENPSSIRLFWIPILRSAAIRKDQKSVKEITEMLLSCNVPMDEDIFWATISAVSRKHQALLGLKMVLKVMPKLNLKANATHYSAVLNGLLLQDQHLLVSQVYFKMIETGVKPNMSCHVAYLLALGRLKLPLQAYLDMFKRIRAAILDPNSTDHRRSSPFPSRFSPSEKGFGIYFEAFAASLRIRRRERSRPIFEAIHEEFRKMQRELGIMEPDYPLWYIVRLIPESKDAWEAKCLWEKFLSKWVVTQHAAFEIDEDDQEEELEISPSRIKFSPSRFIPRTPIRAYMHALSYHGAFDDLLALIPSLKKQGMALLNVTLNDYVRRLCQSYEVRYLMEAFRACETYLMPGFPGWIQTAKLRHPIRIQQRRSRYSSGFYYMRTDMIGQLWPGDPVPQYDTLFRLYAIRAEARSKFIAGHEVGSPKLYVALDDLLEEIAPRTLAALADMPYFKNWEVVNAAYLRVRGLEAQRRDKLLAAAEEETEERRGEPARLPFESTYGVLAQLFRNSVAEIALLEKDIPRVKKVNGTHRVPFEDLTELEPVKGVPEEEGSAELTDDDNVGPGMKYVVGNN